MSLIGLFRSVGAVKIVARALIVGGTRVEVMNSSLFVGEFSVGLVSLGTGFILFYKSLFSGK